MGSTGGTGGITTSQSKMSYRLQRVVAPEPELVVALDVQENHSYITIVHFIVLPSAAGGAGGGTGARTGGGP